MQGTRLIGCLTEPEETRAWQTNRSFHSIADLGVNNTEVGMSGIHGIHNLNLDWAYYF